MTIVVSFYSYSRLFSFFFFSSRRRHTRCLSDWSSDVCSSDLYSHSRGRRESSGSQPSVAWGLTPTIKILTASARHCLRAPQHLGVCDAPLFRSEEHTSELQSLRHLVCRLLLEKKKNRCNVYAN